MTLEEDIDLTVSSWLWRKSAGTQEVEWTTKENIDAVLESIRTGEEPQLILDLKVIKIVKEVSNHYTQIERLTSPYSLVRKLIET